MQSEGLLMSSIEARPRFPSTEELLRLLNEASGSEAKRDVRLGTIGTVRGATRNRATVTFDGETTETIKTYYAIEYDPQVGDRVVLLRAGRTWVIMGEVGGLGRGPNRVPWIPLPYQNGWEDYETGTKPNYTRGEYRKVGDVVQLRGLLRGGTANPITTLPAGFRPPADLIFCTMSSDAHKRIDVRSDGSIHTRGGIPTWVSVSGVSWATTDDGFIDLSLEPGWTVYGAGFQVPRYRIEADDVVRIEGLVAGSTTAGPDVATGSPAPNKSQIFPTDEGGNTHARIDIRALGEVQTSGTTNISYLSLSNINYTTARDTYTDGWRHLNYQNGWVDYTGTDVYYDGGIRRESYGMRRLRGLLVPGTAKTLVGNPDYLSTLDRPGGRQIYAVDSYAGHDRLDVTQFGDIVGYETTGSYFSIEGVTWEAGF